MSTEYFAESFAVTTSPQKLIDAVNFDRTVSLNPQGDLFVGFDNATGYLIPQSIGVSTGRETKFILPHGEELWAATASGTITLSVLVSV